MRIQKDILFEGKDFLSSSSPFPAIQSFHRQVGSKREDRMPETVWWQVLGFQKFKERFVVPVRFNMFILFQNKVSKYI